jgi:5'/3'-nucleotidase
MRQLRILVTNDDGIHAPGIALLEKIALTLSDDVWVVAPEFERSGTSHSLSLTEPIRIRQVDEKKFALRGSPTDCAILSCNHLMKDRRPTLLLSGINRGANTADDITYSGTVAAAMEGTLLGVPSIALSQVFETDQPIKWHTAEHFCGPLLAALAQVILPKGVFLNVNFPAVEPEQVRGVAVTSQGERAWQEVRVLDRVDGRGFPYFWLSFKHRSEGPPEDTDLWAVAGGLISVTPLHCNLSHRASVEQVKQALARLGFGGSR